MPPADPDACVALVRDGYAAIAGRFAASRRGGGARDRAFLPAFLARLPPGAHVVDLGCGSGEPLARALVDAGCRVTGVELCPALIAEAQRRVPELRLLEGDLRRVPLPESAFDGALAWDALFHVPLADHGPLLRRLRAALRRDAPVLLTLGGSGDAFVSDEMGAPLFYNASPPGQALALIAESGFALERSDLDPDGLGHLVVQARAR